MTGATRLIDWDHPGGRVGDQAVRSAVLDLLMVRILRRWIDKQSPGLSSAAAGDPGIVEALHHVHEAPAQQTDVPLAVVADEVGYGLGFAFARAFKREFGMAAGTLRRTLSFADREHYRIAERPEHGK